MNGGPNLRELEAWATPEQLAELDGIALDDARLAEILGQPGPEADTTSRDFIGLQGMAKLLRVAAQTVTYAIEHGCPVHTPGGAGRPYRMHVRTVVRWWALRRHRQKLAADDADQHHLGTMLDVLGPDALALTAPPEDLSINTAQVLKEEEQRVKLAVLRKGLVSAARTEELLVRLFKTLRDGLLQIPEELRRGGIRDDTADMVYEKVCARLEDLSNVLGNWKSETAA